MDKRNPGDQFQSEPHAQDTRKDPSGQQQTTDYLHNGKSCRNTESERNAFRVQELSERYHSARHQPKDAMYKKQNGCPDTKHPNDGITRQVPT
jgi:hypothetical protein